MKNRSLWTFGLGACALSLSLMGVEPAAPSAEEFYARAIEQMRSHPEPAFATYQASISGLKCGVAADGITCSLGRGTPASEKPFALDLRQSDGRVTIDASSKPVVLGDSTFLNPTWPGVDALIRRGFTGIGAATQPTSAPAPAHDASAPPVIAVISTLSVANYDVYDAGAATCATGDAGHAVRLVSRRDPLRYPLTGATIDLRTSGLCALRFNAKINAVGGLFGVTGGATLDLSRVDGYDVVANERFIIDARTIGIAVKHFNIDIAYADFAFPKSIDARVFATPEPTPRTSSQ